MFDNLRRNWWYFIIHWQQHQHVKFLVRCFLTTVLTLLSNGASTAFSSKHFFFFFLRYFSLPPWFLSLSLLGYESFGSFHLVSEFLVVCYSLTTCYECWLPCVKLSLHYENFVKVYIWSKMHERMKGKKENMEITWEPKNG